MNPDVSVVTAVFNGLPYLEDSLRSVLDQEGVSLELIVVDDGSTDGSSEVLEKIAAGDERVRILTQENQGLTRSLIRGCREARGQFIARHDADDLSLPGRLETQLAALQENEGLGLVSCGTRIVGPKGEFLRFDVRDGDPEVATPALLLEKKGVIHGSAMMRREAYEAVGGYRPEFYYGQDADLWLRLAARFQFRAVQEEGYCHRLCPESISGGSRETQREFGRIGQAASRVRLNGGTDHDLVAEARTLSEQVKSGAGVLKGAGRKGIARGNYFIAAQLAAQGDSRCRDYFREAAKADPFFVKAWARWVMAWRMR